VSFAGTIWSTAGTPPSLCGIDARVDGIARGAAGIVGTSCGTVPSVAGMSLSEDGTALSVAGNNFPDGGDEISFGSPCSLAAANATCRDGPVAIAALLRPRRRRGPFGIRTHDCLAILITCACLISVCDKWTFSARITPGALIGRARSERV
jgi:hypothetical protein